MLGHFGGLAVSSEALSPGAGQFPDLWDGELAFIDDMLLKDVRNNSAYNHRWYCIFGRRMYGKNALSPELEVLREKEIKYVWQSHALTKICIEKNFYCPQ